MIAGEWEQAARAVLAGLDESQLYRRRKLVTSIDATHVICDGREYVNFASNNYLGLTHHPQVLAAAERSLREAGTGSGASPLITGYGPAHASAEGHIAKWKGTEAAIILPSGYQANHAAIQTLAAVAEKDRRKLRFNLDKLCHASLIDAVRGTGLPFRIFPHNGLGKLRRLLEEAVQDELQVVVTESIFSMDGDAADLPGLAKLKAESPFTLLLDEAHATGVYGPAGSGLAAEMNLRAAVDVTVITLSKAIGCGGGAVCGSQAFCESLINLARAYIYSTSLPPVLAAVADAAITVMECEPRRQQRLREISKHVRAELSRSGHNILPGDSPIIPVVLGSESTTLSAADRLLQHGTLCLAIRPPTVPRGTSRLRITLCSEHTDAEIERLIRGIREIPFKRADVGR
jgi:8-amino-7-oxononanoate synthase